MSDLVLSIKLEGDAGDLNGEIRISRQEFEKLEKSTEKTGKAAGRSSREVHQLGRQFSESGREAERLNRVNQNLARTLGTVVGTFAGMVGVSAVTHSFIQAASASENFETRLKILLGSAEEGSRLFEVMADYAGRVPFEFEAIMASATQLAGVMKGGVEEIGEWMPLIGDLAAASGLSIQQTTEQVIRMYSAGAASADMFRERGILAMLGFQAGVSYSAEETRQRLMESWKKAGSQFRGATQDLADDWDGLMSMFSDKWFAFQNEVADAGLFDALKSEASDFLGTIDQLAADGTLKEWAQTTSDSLIWMGQHLDEAAIGLGGLMIARTLGPMFNSAAVAVNTYTAAQIRANLAMRTGMAVGTAYSGVMAALGGPAGLIIAGAAALTIWASNASDAAEDTRTLREENEALLKSFENTAKAQVEQQISLTEAKIENLKREIESLEKLSQMPQFADPGNQKAFSDQMAQSRQEITEYQDQLGQLSERLESIGNAGSAAFTKVGNGADDAKKKLDALKKSGQMLMDTLFPEEAAFNKYSEQLNIISQMRQAGIIDVQKEQEAVDQLTIQYLELDEEVKETGKTSSKTMKSMAQETSKAMRIIQQSTDRAMWSAENAFTKFVKTGKLEISDLVDTILDELIRLQFRQSIAPSLQGAFGGLFGGFMGSVPGVDAGVALSAQQSSMLTDQWSWFDDLASGFGFHSGGVGANERSFVRQLPASVFQDAPRFHTGIGPHEMPAVIRKDEGVFTPGQMRALAPVDQIRAASGDVIVHIHEAPGTQTQVQQSRGQDGQMRLDVIIEQVDAALGRRVSTGVGGLNRAMQTTYGLNPAAGAHR